ncbi:MAG TPA: DUF86 domain-containing protein [Thermomicrobiales bacterium]|nr:DUF86 domain-containing protein [Thermomicrobiales bacterium]
MRACRELQDICGEQTRESYLSNRLLNLSVWKLVEIVGEALRQAEMTDPSLVERITDLRAIVNTRNRIIHGYDSVNFNLLWDIVQVEIPPLEETLRALVNEAPDVSKSQERSPELT